MRIYHQCGHNFVWNIDSFTKDGVGDGLILSPANIEAEQITNRVSAEARRASWLDPQFYLPDDSKGKLDTYSFFPANYLEGFNTTLYSDHAREIARQCLQFQHALDFRYLVIPTRYKEELPENHIEQLQELFVDPFLEQRAHVNSSKKTILTVIVRPIQIDEGPIRDELLTWITGLPVISGVYLIFDNNFQSKQIQDPAYLANAMSFIRLLRDNDLEVHVGYSGLEGLLYSIPDATSVTVGAYENLRRFDIQRLQTTEAEQRRAPTPRIYSGHLLQWIAETSMPPIRKLVHDWASLFDDSPYLDYLLNPPPNEKLNFQKAQIYKHYFWVFSNQINEINAASDRADHLGTRVSAAIRSFERITESGVVLAPESDGSHLHSWLNAIAMYKASD